MSRSEEHPAPIDAPASCRWVLLRHDTPDGRWHFDWMLERPSDSREASDARLLTFRLDTPPRFEPRERFSGERLGDHRAAYLDYEGPISGDRGHVRRVQGGALVRLRVDDSRVEIECLVQGRRVMITGSLTRPDGSAIADTNVAPRIAGTKLPGIDIDAPDHATRAPGRATHTPNDASNNAAPAPLWHFQIHG